MGESIFWNTLEITAPSLTVNMARKVLHSPSEVDASPVGKVQLVAGASFRGFRAAAFFRGTRQRFVKNGGSLSLDGCRLLTLARCSMLVWKGAFTE